MTRRNPQYSLTLRNKFLTVDAENITDMIESLQSHVNFLKELRDAGIELEHGQEDDYATFYTEDKEIADRFGFNLEEDWEEDEDFDEESWDGKEGF